MSEAYRTFLEEAKLGGTAPVDGYSYGQFGSLTDEESDHVRTVLGERAGRDLAALIALGHVPGRETEALLLEMRERWRGNGRATLYIDQALVRRGIALDLAVGELFSLMLDFAGDAATAGLAAQFLEEHRSLPQVQRCARQELSRLAAPAFPLVLKRRVANMFLGGRASWDSPEVRPYFEGALHSADVDSFVRHCSA